MKPSLPPLNWLRAFEAAARHLSFTGAAGEMNMTQSAVSQQIKSLEAHLGRPLFHRRPKALELTETGMTYLPVVREAFRTLTRGTRSIIGGHANVVQVQSNLSYAVFFLAPRLKRFYERHPDVALNFVTDIWEPRDLREEPDVEIRFALSPPGGHKAIRLTEDRYYPVAAPDYDVTLETLTEVPLFDCANMYSNWASWAEEAGLNWPNPRVTYATTYTVTLELAEAGAGVAMAHDTVARGRIADGRLAVPFAQRFPMGEGYYLITGSRADQLPATKLFTDWLQWEHRQAAFTAVTDQTRAGA